jgi:hypothetical protein
VGGADEAVPVHLVHSLVASVKQDLSLILTSGQPWTKRVLRPLRARQTRPFEPLSPIPHFPTRTLDVDSAWKGIEVLLPEILDRFNVGRERCLEFGVEFGYSIAALSAHFDQVTGVDLFTGDIHTLHKGDHFAKTAERLGQFDNIELVRADYRNWIEDDDSTYDLIHVDIVHTYDDTYRCGLWAVDHAPCVLFHDTESFASVRAAVVDVAFDSGREFHNFRGAHGLGIVV